MQVTVTMPFLKHGGVDVRHRQATNQHPWRQVRKALCADYQIDHQSDLKSFMVRNFRDDSILAVMTENELVSIIGADAARKLVDRFGGADLNIPRSNDTAFAKSIADVIGAKPASALIQWARGCRIYVEKNASRERAIRASEIRAMLNQGMTVAEVSQKFSYRARLSERAIYAILREV